MHWIEINFHNKLWLTRVGRTYNRVQLNKDKNLLCHIYGIIAGDSKWQPAFKNIFEIDVNNVFQIYLPSMVLTGILRHLFAISRLGKFEHCSFLTKFTFKSNNEVSELNQYERVCEYFIERCNSSLQCYQVLL